MSEAVNKSLALDDSVKVNKRGEAILGTLTGPCADIVNPTRNGRFYSEELWEKVFNNDIVKEYFEAGGILGELDHPTDRAETCTEKVAICMPEPPKKDENGVLVGKWDILDTPNGRIAYTLAKYGYKLGISSRGTGDVIDRPDGEYVDEDTYDFQAFDLVLLPAVKAARLKMVESYNGKTFKQAINESLEKADPEGRAIMESTLHNLNIDYEGSDESIDSKSETKTKADNDGLSVVKDLQESLKREKELKGTVANLQEKLSVSNAKEAKLREELDKYKGAVVSLSDMAKKNKELQSQIDALNEQLAQKDERLTAQSDRNKALVEGKRTEARKSQTLTEQLGKKDEEIAHLKSQLSESARQQSRVKKSLTEQLDKANAQIEQLKGESEIKRNDFNAKLTKSKAMTEKYQKIAYDAVDRYIELRADTLGVTANEIKSRLSENYTFDDIDTICEDLQEYQLNISALPFDISKAKSKRVVVKESKETIGLRENADDVIDESLLKLANLK